MKTALWFVGWWVGSSVLGFADTTEPAASPQEATARPGKTQASFEEHWRQVRNQQPDGLTLELRLPKTTFYQGEIIEATLVFANHSTNLYAVDPRNYDRSGRLDDIAFFAASTDGKAVLDPLGWYFQMVGMGGGLSSLPEKLGEWTLSMAANQWLRFDRPGRYRLYAWTRRTSPGSGDIEEVNGPPIELVSPIRNIEIRPLEWKLEQEVIARARTDLAQGGDKALAAASRLRHLQTPAAREVLRSVVERADGNLFVEASCGLLGSPEPALEAAPLLKAGEGADCTVSQGFASLYSVLKSYPVAVKPAEPFTFQEFMKVKAQASAEFAARMRAVLPHKRGPALMTTVIWLLTQNPRDQVLRELLLKNLAQLTQDEIGQIAEMWFNHSDGHLIGGKEWLGGQDLLPILRWAVQSPRSDAKALACLLRAAPNETWPLIREDIASKNPRFLTSPESSWLLYVMTDLPAHESPDLDPVFRRWLSAGSGGLNDHMFLIERLGSTDLLADVVKFYQPAEGKWACEIQNCVLRYWIRCDPKEGVAALGRALRARQHTGCYRTVLSSVLTRSWVAEARPLVIAALEDNEPEVVTSAVGVLERHSTIEDFPRLLGALDRWARAGQDENKARWVAEGVVGILLPSGRWRLTPEQLTQLASKVKDRALKDQIMQRVHRSR